MRHSYFTLPLTLVSAMALVQQANAEDFVAQDVRIEGLVRLAPASVYGVLPVSSGDQVTDAKVADSIRALYATGNFDDIQSVRDGNTLVFKVIERPVISSVTFTGNKLIPTDTLKQGLKSLNLTEGQVLKRATLQNIENELEQQYAQQGRYDADVTVETTPRANNRVDLNFKFIEGTAAKVFDINVIGNTVFKDSDILQAFAVKESSWSSVLTRNDRYARERMTASLESLRALYLNKGYVNFNVNNAQLNISDDKKRIFIEVSISEGEQYKFGQTKFLGDTLFSQDELRPLAIFKEGATYSQAQVNAVKELLTRKYGNAGYYFAEINAVPDIDEANKTVNLNYYINPGKQVTVRRINFNGNTKTADEVLRREMRQMEGALATNEKIDLSKVRLERTGYFKTVAIEPVRVPNTADQIDLNVKVEEQNSGTSTVAVGYSQGGGVTFQLGLSQTNFLGTGNQVAIDLSRSETLDYYNLNVLDPYFTIDGVSRGYNAYMRKTKLDKLNVSTYVTDSLGGSLTFGYPLDENQNVSASFNVDDTQISTGQFVSVAIRDYLLANGGKTTRTFTTTKTVTRTKTNPDTGEIIRDVDGKPVQETIQVPDRTYGNAFEGDYLTYNLNLAWAYNTLNRPVFPTKGMYHRLSLDIALPGSDVEYQKLTYDGQALFPLGDKFVLRTYSKLGYGNDLPFYKNYFAGGYGSVRGYKESTLGPRSPAVIYQETGTTDTDPEAIGGNALIQGGVELVLPVPFKGDWSRQIRPVLFVEGGQVYNTDASDFEINADNIRYSAGVGFTWITVIGPLSLSYAYPLNQKDGDETKRVQFEIGRTF
ncbi:outer membrane protein assembly factor BamA [Alkanindiges illinoisensis]|uniref:outer membrane protein assembly factor BamA n=1 Tax=Alkanindiges illinoisensis TaxID=197183 RepID=UPI00047B0AE6|nr:outer membrane protein assembly factor BamA [Alkanindiges illinoisensis]